jgi:hypothetical protein
MEKTEQVSVEEFISRLIRHIPDVQFKTIRHYGEDDLAVSPVSKKRKVEKRKKKPKKFSNETVKFICF